MVDTTSLQGSAGSSARSARSTVARPGLIGRALFYLLFGLLALDLAFGSSDASQGAVERVASAPFGRFLLIGLTVSLLALVAWKALQAIVGDPVEGSETTDRVKYAFEALAYTGLAATSVTLLIANWDSSNSSGTSSGGSDSSSDTQTEATATVLEWPAGQWLVVLGGLAIIGFALFTAYKHAIDAKFRQRLDTSSLSQSAQQGVDWIGRAGYAGKSVISAVIGMFLVIAGLQHDPGETEGLSGALRSLSDSGWGTALLCSSASGCSCSPRSASSKRRTVAPPDAGSRARSPSGIRTLATDVVDGPTWPHDTTLPRTRTRSNIQPARLR